MATFNDKAKELSKIFDLMEKYLKDGKYNSVDFRGKANKLSSLQKLVDMENEKEVKILEKLQTKYAELYTLKKNYNAAIQKVSDSTEKEVKRLKKQTQIVEKSVQQVAASAKETSDVFNDSEVPKLIKGNKKEENTVIELVSELAKYRDEASKNTKKIHASIKDRLKKYKGTNKNTARLEKILDRQIIYTIKQEEEINKCIEEILKKNKFLNIDKNGLKFHSSDIILNAMNVITGEMYKANSPAYILDRIYQNQDFINLQGKANIKKIKGDESALLPIRWGSTNSTYMRDQSSAGRFVRKFEATVPQWLNTLMSHFGVYGPNADRFKYLTMQTMYANMWKNNMTEDDFDDKINDMLGFMYSTVSQLLNSENLPEEFQEAFNIKSWNKHGRKGELPGVFKILGDMKKAIIAFRKYSYYGPLVGGGIQVRGKNGRIYNIKDESDLKQVTDADNNPVSPEDFKNYSFYNTFFKGLATDSKTVDAFNNWDSKMSGHSIELTKSVFDEFDRLYNTKVESDNPDELNTGRMTFNDLGDFTKASITGGKADKANKTGSIKISKNFYSDEEELIPSALGAIIPQGSNGDILLHLNGVQRRLDSIIALLGGDPTTDAQAQSKLGVSTGIPSDDDVLSTDEPTTGKGKSSYQSKQDRRDRKVDGYRTFIKMLVPALKALLPKHAMWDALKLLLLQFGHNHPKLAAAALLAGPPVVAGAATLAGKALLRGTLGSVLGNTPRATAVSRSARALSGAGGRNSIMTNITSNVTSYKNNRDWINYMRGEIPELERKAQVGRAANLLKQNPPRTRVNSDLLDLRIQEGLQAEKDLKYIRRTLPVREKYLVGNRVNAAWNTTQDAVTNFGGNVRSTTNNIWNGAKNPQTYIKGAKGYGGALKGFTTGGLGAVGKGFAGFGKGLLGVAKGGLSLAKAAGPEAMLATIVVGTIVGAIKPIAQAIIEPFKIIIDPMKGLMGSLGDAFSGIWAAIKGILHPLIALGDACWEIGKSVGGLLGNFLKPFVRLLAGPFAVVTNIVINSFRVLGSLIGLVGKVIGTVGTIIGDFIYAIIGLGKVIGGWIAHSPIGRAVSGLWKKFDSAVQGFFEGIGNFFTSLTDKVVDAFRTFGNFITNWWESFKKNHPILSGLIDVGKGKSGASVGGVVPEYEDKYNEELNKVSDNVTNKELAAKLNVLKNDGAIAGQALAADAAANAAGTYGSCLKYVENAVQRTYGFDLGRKNSAYEATKKLDSLAKNGTLNKVNTDSLKTADGKYGGLKNLPAGSIVVWGKGTSKHGHISISDGKGNEISDHIEKQMLSHYGGAAPSVYLPKGTELKGTTTMTAAEIAAQTSTQSETSSSTATLTESKVETTDGVRNALLQLAGTVKEKQSKYDAESIVFNATDVTGSMGCWGIVQLNNEGRPVH